MLTPLLIMVREGFEGFLVVAILFAYLRRIGRADLRRPVWLGVVAAAATATAVGVVIHLTVGTLDGPARLRSFAVISVLAAAVLTWMVFWMRRQSRTIKNDLEEKIDEAIGAGNARTAIVGVAFLAVLREGIEASLFLIAAATDASGRAVLAGAVLGLGLAALLGWVIYVGGRRLAMQTFFRVSGLVVIVFAAGLLARTVLFLQASGTVGTLADNIYDLRSIHWLTQDSEVGKFLAALFGWDPRPSVEQVLAWGLYLVPVTVLFLRRPRATTVAPEAARLATEVGEPGHRSYAASGR